MPKLTEISLDILLLIIEQLTEEGSPLQPLKSLCLVCRRFRDVAASALFQHAIIRVPQDDERDISRNILDRTLRFLAFLSEYDHIRSKIQHLSIFRQSPEHVPRDQSLLNLLLRKLMTLLPLMSQLSHIRISRIGSTRFPLSKESEEYRFLETVQGLKSAVTLSVFGHRGTHRGYIHTWNPDLFLDKVTCLKSLQIDILNQPEIPRHSGPLYRDFNGTPSKDIARTIKQNPRLRHIHLRLDGWKSFAEWRHDQEAEEHEHALENIGKHVHTLESLSLEGELHFTQSAWNVWDRNVNWASLRSLCVMTEPLIEEVTGHLINCLPNLETLRLDVQHLFKVDSTINRSNTHRFQIDVKSFLSSVTPTDLSLTGFHPNNLVALEDSGASLRRLQFHAQEGPMRWLFGAPGQLIQSPASFKDVLLSSSHLDMLQRACSKIEWLAFDISPFHLSNNPSSLHTPMSGHSPAAYNELLEGFGEIVNNLERWAASIILQHQNPHKDSPSEADPIFTSLICYSSLRHLRLFIHGARGMRWSFSRFDAMNLFLWLRAHKVGVALESLLVFGGPEMVPKIIRVGEVGPWIVHGMGAERLCTIDGGETILWNVKGNDRPEFEIVERTMREGLYGQKPAWNYSVWDQLEELDTTGWAVPTEWP